MKQLSLCLGTFAVLSVLAGCGGTSTMTPANSPSFALQVMPTTVTLTAGGTSQVLTVGTSSVNNFSGSVAVKLGSLPAGVTATPSTLSLAVGSIGQITLSAAADSVPSQVDLPVSASSGEDQQSAKASLIIAQPIATASLSTLSFDFGDNLAGNALSKTAVTVVNTGSTALTLSPSLSGDTSFVLATGAAASSSSCGQQLAPAASCNVVLVYTPASMPGVQTATLNLGMGGVAAGTQQIVAISGTSYAIPVGQVTPTNNPQVALYTLTLPFPGSASVNFGTDTKYGLDTWTQASGAAGGPISLFVAGMRASTTYHMQAAITFANGITVTDTDHTFTTGAVPANMALNATTVTAAGMTPQSGVELLNPLAGKPSGVIITDLSGNPLWTYSNPGNPALNFIDGVKFLPNGNFLMTIGPSNNILLTGALSANAINEIREVNLAGDTVREISITDLNDRLASATCAECNVKLDVFHHDVDALPNGHWLVLASTRMNLSGSTQPALTNLPASTVLGDVIVDLDENLQPVWAWNEFNHVDPNRHPYLFPDWTHTNAVLYSKDDGNLIVSMRHQNWVVKVKYADGTGDGSILWRLGEGGDLTLKGGNDPTDWAYAQHDPTFFSAATAGVLSVGLMDNGDDRQLPGGVVCGDPGSPACFYTTIPVFQIDESAKTATLIFHQILPPTLYSFFGGSTDLLANGDVHYALCGLGANSAIYEVTQQSTPQTVWSMQVQGTNTYRASRLPSLYPGVQW